MHLHTFEFKGFFEDNPDETTQHVQLVVPEDDIETAVLAWAILPHPETVEGDSARTDYLFRYELGDPLENGLFVLTVTGRDQATHTAEIAAGLSVAGADAQKGPVSFAPIWLIDKSRHVTFPDEHRGGEGYHRPAFGTLQFGGTANLPHRRLFGATI